MNFEQIRTSAESQSLLGTHVVLRNTYMLLSLTLLFSAATAYWSLANAVPMPGILFFIIGSYGLLFLTMWLRNSIWGLVSVFGFTGFMGYTLGPLLNAVLKTANGSHIVMTALGMTGLIFFGLSAVVLVTRKNFSFLANFLFAGMLALVVAMVVGLFWHVPALYLAISAGFAVFSSVMIMFETSQIIEGGQTNYIMATISLYVSLYNIFVSLLNILSFFNDRR
ncbi:MAG: inhibitor (BI)/YccA family protein [Gammaproteobacteria bacterium]|jgi:modulator of FtsH protease|nr:inhibitor (BI)/YccA family protein [Gammaproteobacteria bacterium]